MRKKGLAKVLLSFEAFFGSFYVSVSRGLFVPMLAYFGYLLDRVSTITFFAAVLNVVISYLIYYNPAVVSRNAKAKLLLFHIIERVIWTSLPFMLYSPDLLTITYGLAQSITIPVGVLLNVAMLDVFKDEEFVEISVLRSAVASAASLIGSLFTIYITILLDPPQSYYVSNVVSGLVGLLTASLIGKYMPQNPFLIYGLAASLKALALLVVLIAIPETAVVPTETAYGYGKLIYAASVLGYTFTVETSLKIFKIFLQVLALTTLALLLLFIYGVVIILTSGV